MNIFWSGATALILEISAPLLNGMKAGVLLCKCPEKSGEAYCISVEQLAPAYLPTRVSEGKFYLWEFELELFVRFLCVCVCAFAVYFFINYSPNTENDKQFNSC